MRILIIGANGAAGCRIATEAEARGHTVTRAGRTRPDRGASGWVQLDAADARAVAGAAAGHDVLIGATRPRPDQEQEIEPVTQGLAEGVGTAGVRLIVVGGAGPLRVPGSGQLAIDEPQWVPPVYREAAAASVRQLVLLEATSGVDWAYLAPAALFQPGDRTGRYRTGGDSLVIAPDGTSAISMEDFAIASLDEVEAPTTRCGILSVGT
ncbi:NAD(P)-dependent oxidoreductase [Ornithinimicrobium murale]|uniref:NAD(P)-dependent oxidoreductase n=1 Tax=Ornithinimicrobium murale TaxID=1050153 RepID=UPI000E0CE077|nr:NAD(P)H-binding protein [Ornithinimicrobium murale]